MNRSLYGAAFAAIMAFSASSVYAQKNVKWVESGKVIEEGIKHHDEESYQDAIAKYKLVHRNDTLYHTALYELAFTYKEAKEYDKAIEACKEGIALRSSNGPLFYNIYASALDMAERKEESIKIFDEGLKNYPLNLMLMINKGITLRRMERDADAVDVFQRVALINPYYASAHYQLGMVAAENNKIVPAILSLQTFLLIEHQTQRSLNALILLESLTKGDHKVNMDSVVAFHGETGDFSSIETLLASKIALSKKYELQVKTTYDFIRPVQLVFEKLKYRPSDKGFWMQYYVPLFTKLWEKDQFEPFVHHILGTLNDEAVQKLYKKNQPKIKEMLTIAGDHIKSMSKKGPDIKEYAYAGLPHWYTDGYLQSVGNIGSDGETHTGAWTMFSRTGVKLAQGSYQNGKKHGTWYYFREDGTPSSKEELVNGELNGVSTLYSDAGVPSMNITYKNGIADGEIVSFFPAGQKKATITYKADKKNGLGIDYYENGQVESEVNYKDGMANGPCKVYFSTGEPEYEYSFLNDNRHGAYKTFHQNGKVQLAGNYTEGKRNGEFKTYYDNGNLKQTENYVNDLSEGKSIEYFADGKTIETEREYKGSKLQRIKYNDEDGILYRDLVYKDGKLIKYTTFDKKGAVLSQAQNNKGDMQIVFYNPNGNKRSEGKTTKGEMDGAWKFYQPNGTLDVEETYDNGYLTGTRKEYYNNGKLFEETKYADGQRDGYYQSFHKNGNMRAEGYYKTGEQEGEWVFYHENGKISAREYFIHGVKTGYQTYYNPDETISTEEYFEGNYLNNYKTFEGGKVAYASTLKNGSGVVKENLANGKLRKSCTYKNGLIEGPFETYYPNGKLQQKVNYKGDLREGAFVSYYPDGKIANEGNYVHGKKEGIWKWYYDNGKLELQSNYKNNLIDGERTWFYQDGTKQIVNTYKEDEINGYQHHYAPDGTLRVSYRFKNGRLVAYTYLGKDGQPLPEIEVKNESVKFVAYFPSGQKSAEGEFKNNYREGTFTYYNKDGKPGMVWVYNANEQEGVSKEFNVDGSLNSEEPFVNGNLHGEAKYYNEKGKLLRSITYVMGEKHGDEKIYNAEGKLVETRRYAYDVKQN